MGNSPNLQIKNKTELKDLIYIAQNGCVLKDCKSCSLDNTVCCYIRHATTSWEVASSWGIASKSKEYAKNLIREML